MLSTLMLCSLSLISSVYRFSWSLAHATNTFLFIVDASPHGKIYTPLNFRNIVLTLSGIYLQAIIFSLIIIRAAKGRQYPKVHTSILGTVQFVRRSAQTTTTRHDTTGVYATHGDTILSESQHEVRLDLEAGAAQYYERSSSRSVMMEKIADEKPEFRSISKQSDAEEAV